jgi:hypothetical protein
VVEHKVTVKLRDGRVITGYTPGFDPADGSIWVTPEVASPQGVMVALERISIVILERLDRRPVVPPGPTLADPSVAIRLDFADGESLFGRKKPTGAARGVWVQPEGRPFARAFVPDGGAAVAEVDEAAFGDESSESGWTFAGSISVDALPLDVGVTPTPRATPVVRGHDAAEGVDAASDDAPPSGDATLPPWSQTLAPWSSPPSRRTEPLPEPGDATSATPFEGAIPAALADALAARASTGETSGFEPGQGETYADGLTGDETLKLSAVERPDDAAAEGAVEHHAPDESAESRDVGATLPDTPLSALFGR